MKIDNRVDVINRKDVCEYIDISKYRSTIHNIGNGLNELLENISKRLYCEWNKNSSSKIVLTPYIEDGDKAYEVTSKKVGLRISIDEKEIINLVTATIMSLNESNESSIRNLLFQKRLVGFICDEIYFTAINTHNNIKIEIKSISIKSKDVKSILGV